MTYLERERVAAELIARLEKDDVHLLLLLLVVVVVVRLVKRAAAAKRGDWVTHFATTTTRPRPAASRVGSEL